MRRIRALSWLFPVFLMHGCNGCELQQLNAASRRIAVDVCTKEPNINGKGGVEECAVDFGVLPLAKRETREVTISNVAEEDIHISGFRFTDTSDPAFSVEHYPDVIKAGLSSKMLISFRPLLESQVSGELILLTDAQNALVPQEGQIAIQVTGGGVDNGLPGLQVDVLDGNGDMPKGCCDLGLVAVGSVATCRVRLTNNGTRPLVLDEVAFDPVRTSSGAWTAVGAMPVAGDHSHEAQFTIDPGASTTLSFRFSPQDLNASRATVVLRTNAPRACGPVGAFDQDQCNRRDFPSPCPTADVGKATVDMRGQGANPPTCVARIKSVNGSSTFDPRLIAPLDDVELTAEDSTTSVPGLTISGYHWEIRSKPPGSNSRFDDPTAANPHFVFDNTSTNIIRGLDVAGEYVARCEAIDSRGMHSVNDGTALLTIVATPSEAIHVQLVWDTAETDVDLHLLREVSPGVYNEDSGDDCYYANCKLSGGFGSAPMWDSSSSAHQGGNPSLDVDDTQGYGPENSNIDVPRPGKYKAAVYYFSDDGLGETVATIRIYIYGNLRAEYHKLIANHDWWDVGIIDWPSGTWTEVDALQLP